MTMNRKTRRTLNKIADEATELQQATEFKHKVFVSYTYKNADGDTLLDRAIFKLPISDLRTEGDIGAVEQALAKDGARRDVRLLNWRALEG